MLYEIKPVNIDGWEMYKVDTNGVVYGQKGKPLKPSINHSGYQIVNFNHNKIRKGFSVHTIVAKTFIPNPLGKKTVNHLDGNKQNNCVQNLEWATYHEQMQHAIHILHRNIGQWNTKQVYGLDKRTYEIKYNFSSIADAARYFAEDGKNYRHIQNIISMIANGDLRRKSYRGCVWISNTTVFKNVCAS